ncbi:MAG: vitamin K epoxide reductase family protein [Candidatus Eremiobacteraeota bacterium]|nr:vitamin K epoxide reductase family protein [Candidatus Eremiobacteraeota bacterium]
MIQRGAILALCALGFYLSAFMYRKSQRASRHALSEPSVVESPRARAVAGLPNSAFGLVYYAALAVAVPLLGWPPAHWAALAASIAAAAFSLYLAHSLLFVTRMPCVYCWTSHALNWALPFLIATAT